MNNINNNQSLYERVNYLANGYFTLENIINLINNKVKLFVLNKILYRHGKTKIN